MIVWLASYPRSGNTLLRLMLKSVFDLDSFSKHDDAADIGSDPQIAAAVGHQFLPSPWIDAYPRMRAASQTYLVKTHDDAEDMGNAIYIVRDGRSACRSFYHYLKEFPHLRARFSLRDVVAGFTPFGSWSEHLSEWDPLKRRGTLLLKYEELLSQPQVAIAQLSDFLQKPIRHDWHNDFEKFRDRNPRFFRAGADNDPASALTGADLAIFWQEHGEWMKRLGYPGPGPRPPRARNAFRAWMSGKGRDFYNLSHRTYDAEQQVQELLPEVIGLKRDLDDARKGTEALNARLDTTAREGQALSTQLAEATLELTQSRQTAAAKEAELSNRLRETIDAARAAESEHEIKAFQLSAAIETTRREAEARAAESQATLDRQLSDWNHKSGQLLAELEAQRARATELSGRLADQRAESEQAVELHRQAIAAFQSQLTLERDQVAGERRQRALEQQRHAELLSVAQRKIDELTAASYVAQRQFARALQQHRSGSEKLMAAVYELNTRLRMLLSSRLLHLGWKIGLGQTPYWNSPEADELTELLEQIHPKVGKDYRQILQRLGSASPPREDGGGDMQTALSHLFEKGFRPKVVLDIGAAKGYWTLNTAYRWKEAEFFMIDPLAESEADLQAICVDPRFHYLRLAIGDCSGELRMHVATDPDSSSLLLTSTSDPATHQTVDVRTIDQLLESGQIKPAQLVKVDVQGYEMNVLRGALKLFEHAEVFILEANLFEFMPGCPRVHELIAFMADRGFYPFDFAGFLRRPFENDLGQIDIVFVSCRSPLVASNRWLPEAIVIEQEQHPMPPKLDDGMVISVIICTNDPRPDIFWRTLDALNRQTLAPDRFEVIIVDNASRLTLEERQLREGNSLPIKLIREPIPGLSRARVAGIATARGGLLVFVDDDNFLSPDYLENALEIARRESRIGLFGGIAVAELESPIANWKRPALAHLGVRDHGSKPITQFADHWGEWEPIGAGMVARRPVAERFVRMFEEIPEARLLGRAGADLLSGEDSLFARAAYREGYACSYQPALRLTHFLKSSRLTFAYMSRVVEGHGRSFVILQRALGKPVARIKLRTALARVLYRLHDVGPAGLITGRWEVGYARELASPSKDVKVEVPPAVSLLPATLAVSVVLCTRNPRADLLARTLDSIDRQDLPRGEFELIVVDNGSERPIDAEVYKPGRSVRSSVLKEPRVGHVFARAAGICASRGSLIVFVDDDNFLAADYLSQAVEIARMHPEVGAFGGIASPEFESKPADWKQPLLKFLAVRDHGEIPIISREDHWGAWEPIGAGMVVRRPVAERFAQWIRDLPGAADLGRSQRHLMSGDDALFSRAAHRMGYATSYQPALTLTHYMKSGRLGLRYLAKLISGNGRTYTLLNLIMEKPSPRIGLCKTISLLGFRLQQGGRTGLLLWCWDWGRWRETRRRRDDPRMGLPAVTHCSQMESAITDPQPAVQR